MKSTVPAITPDRPVNSPPFQAPSLRGQSTLGSGGFIHRRVEEALDNFVLQSLRRSVMAARGNNREAALRWLSQAQFRRESNNGGRGLARPGSVEHVPVKRVEAWIGPGLDSSG